MAKRTKTYYRTGSSNLQIVIITLLLLAKTSSVCAQRFPQKDEDGKVIYYKIITANKDFCEKCLCLQDESNMAGDGFQYVLQEHDGTNKRQEWNLIAVDPTSETYYLRNRMTYRYLSVDTQWINGVLVPVYSKITDGNSLNISQIQEGDNQQVTISFSSIAGQNYFTVTDISKGMPMKPQTLVGSAWAWYIVPAEEVSMDIDNLEEATRKQMEYYDLSGRRIPIGGYLMHGVYLVKKNGEFHKVLR